MSPCLLTFRVTLGNNGHPLAYDSMHNCGCYHTVYPVSAELEQARRGWQEPLVVPQRVADMDDLFRAGAWLPDTPAVNQERVARRFRGSAWNRPIAEALRSPVTAHAADDRNVG